MTKYIRSRAKLIKLVKEVFGVSGISMDTKVIILFLAATRPHNDFKAWINAIPQLNPFNAHLQEINLLRHTFGNDFRNYILLMALQNAKHKISSAELQQFMSMQDMAPLYFKTQNIPEEIFAPAYNNAARAGEDDFERAMLIAKPLLDKTAFTDLERYPQVLLNIYLACRRFVSCEIAANALIYTLWQALRVENASADANIISKKLVLRALQPFVTRASRKPLLFTAQM